MDSQLAVLAFGALGQSTRLNVFRLLIRCEPDGIPSGEIARQLAVPPNTISSHLSALVRAGLIVSVRRSRCVIYRAKLDPIRSLAGFLVKDCCGGHPNLCGSAIAHLSDVEPSPRP